MADLTEFKNMIRVGLIMSVDESKMTARVKFGDKGGIISGPLHILKRPVYVIPAKNSESQGKTAETKLQYDVNDITHTVGHSHGAVVSSWIPAVNDMVLCLMTPDGEGDGFIIGEV